MERSYTAHILKNTSLVLLSLAGLPLTVPTFLFLYLLSAVVASAKRVSIDGIKRKASERESEMTVLITGVSMQKGLTLARLFHLYGISRPESPRIRVIGADFSSLAMGAVSKSISRFYKLTPPVEGDEGPYVESLLQVIQQERVDLWVSCSGVASAVEDGVARDTITRVTDGRCRCVQFGEQDTSMLHEKGSFMQAVTKAGLAIPETHVVTDSVQVNQALEAHHGTGKKFIIKPLGVVDRYRADMTRLPLPTREATQKHLLRIPISQEDPFILQEFIDGKEYCTHAVVLKGRVVAFVACESASVLMHYVALPEKSPLTKSMLKFTVRMAEWGQEQADGRGDGSEFTGHMSFDFLVHKEDENGQGGEIRIWPIECNPRTHTAVVLFDGDAGIDMIRPYIHYVEHNRSEQGVNPGRTIVYGAAKHSYYWIPHDMVAFLLLPLWRGFLDLANRTKVDRGSTSDWSTVIRSMRAFFVHLGSPKWRDASLELWDPLPAWWLWHVYWPSRFIECLFQGYRWSEINVSTGKIFGC